MGMHLAASLLAAATCLLSVCRHRASLALPPQVWDFSVSTTRPLAQYNCPAGQQATSLLFAPACPVVVCGSSDGAVAVLRLHGPHVVPGALDQQQLEARLEAALAANVIKTQPAAAAAGGGSTPGSTMSTARI